MTNTSNQNPDPNSADPGGSAPRVAFKMPQVPGVLPKNIRAIGVLCLTGLMLAVMFLSPGGVKQKSEKTGPAQPPFASNAREIEQYKAVLEQETRKLASDRQRMLNAKNEAEAAANSALAMQAPPPPGYQNAPYANGASPERDPIEVEQKLQALDKAKREERSLYASNVALTFRSENPGASSPDGTSVVPRSVQNRTQESAVNQDAAKLESQAAIPKTAQDIDRRRSANGDSPPRDSEGPLYRLFEGTLIETVLTNRLDGSFAGPVNVMVTTNVYSHDHQQLLIPQGTRVLGEVEKVAGTSQQRLAVKFHRLIMPDGFVHSLDQFHALSQAGETGLRDQVNHHYVSIFGASLAIGAIAGVAQAGSNYSATVSGIDAYQRGVSQSLSESSLHILDRFLNVLPTFTIREGHRIKIILTDDILLPGYAGHKLPANL